MLHVNVCHRTGWKNHGNRNLSTLLGWKITYTKELPRLPKNLCECSNKGSMTKKSDQYCSEGKTSCAYLEAIYVDWRTMSLEL